MDHLVIHRHEAYTLQKEAEAEAKDFVERTKGLFERFVDWCRSTGSYVLPLPGRVAVNAGLVCYDTYTLATRLLSPEQSLDIKGLSSESERAFVEQTAHLYDRILSVSVPAAALRSDTMQRLKDGAVHELLKKILSSFPEYALRQITPDAVTRLFEEGIAQAALTGIEENITDITAEHIEAVMMASLTQVFGQQSPELDLLLDRFNLKKGKDASFLFDVTKKEDGSYTVKCFCSETKEAELLLDRSEWLHPVYIYDNVTEEKLKSFCKELPKFKSQHDFSIPMIPGEFANLLDVPYTVDRTGTYTSRLFESSDFLRMVRTEVSKEVFGDNAEKTDELFLYLEIADLAELYAQKGNELSSKQCVQLMEECKTLTTHVSALRNETKKTAHLETLDELHSLLRTRMYTAMNGEKGSENKPCVIPPLLMPLFDQMFAAAGSNSVALRKTAEGIERALGSEYKEMIQAARKEIEARSPQAKETRELSAMEKLGAFCLCTFTQFIIFDLINYLTGCALPAAWGISAIAGTGLGALASSESRAFIPVEYWDFYEEAWSEALYCLLPFLMEWGYWLFTTNEMKETVRSNVRFIDACSFRASFREDLVEQAEEAQENPEEHLPSSAKEALSGFHARNEAFCEAFRTFADTSTLKTEDHKERPHSYLKELVSKRSGDATVLLHKFLPSTHVEAIIDHLQMWSHHLVDCPVVIDAFSIDEIANATDVLRTNQRVQIAKSGFALPDASHFRIVAEVKDPTKKRSAIYKGVELFTTGSCKKESVEAQLSQGFDAAANNFDIKSVQAAFTAAFTFFEETGNKAEMEAPRVDTSDEEPSQLLSSSLQWLTSFLPNGASRKKEEKTEKSAPETPSFFTSLYETLEPFLGIREKDRKEGSIDPSPLSDLHSYFPQSALTVVQPKDVTFKKVLKLPAEHHLPDGCLIQKEELTKALQAVVEVGKGYPDFSGVLTPDAFFKKSQELKAVFKEQMRMLLTIDSRVGPDRADRIKKEYIRQTAEAQILRSLRSMKEIFEGPNAALFSQKDWSSEHTNALCELASNLRQMGSFHKQQTRACGKQFDPLFLFRHGKKPTESKNTSPSFILLTAGLAEIAETLLSKEKHRYAPLGFAKKIMANFHKHHSVSFCTTEERALYDRLASTVSERDLQEAHLINFLTPEVCLGSRSITSLYDDPKHFYYHILERVYESLTENYATHTGYIPEIVTDKQKLLQLLKTRRKKCTHTIKVGDGTYTVGIRPLIDKDQETLEQCIKWLENRDSFLPLPIHNLVGTLSQEHHPDFFWQTGRHIGAADAMLSRASHRLPTHARIHHREGEVIHASLTGEVEDREPESELIQYQERKDSDIIAKRNTLPKSVLPQIVDLEHYSLSGAKSYLISLLDHLADVKRAKETGAESSEDILFYAAERINRHLSFDLKRSYEILSQDLSLAKELFEDITFQVRLDTKTNGLLRLILRDTLSQDEISCLPHYLLEEAFLQLILSDEDQSEALAELSYCMSIRTQDLFPVHQYLPEDDPRRNDESFKRRAAKRLICAVCRCKEDDIESIHEVESERVTFTRKGGTTATQIQTDSNGYMSIDRVSKSGDQEARPRPKTYVLKIPGNGPVSADTHVRSITVNEKIYFPLPFFSFNGNKQNVYVSLGKSEHYYLIKQGDEWVEQKIASTTISKLRKARIASDGKHLVFPEPLSASDHPILRSFARGSLAVAYRQDDKTSYRITYTHKHPASRFSLWFTEKDGMITCDEYPGYTLSKTQYIEEGHCFMPYIVLEKDGKKAILYKGRDLTAGAIPLVSSKLGPEVGQSIRSALSLFPELLSITGLVKDSEDNSSFSFMHLDDNGACQPKTPSQFMSILLGNYALGGNQFEQSVNRFIEMMNIDEGEAERFPIETALVIVGLVQLFEGVPKNLTATLHLLVTGLQNKHLRKKESLSDYDKAQIVIASLLYNSYISTKMYQHNPLPLAAEAALRDMMLDVIDILFKEPLRAPMRLGIDPHSLFHSLAREGLYPILMTLFSKEFTDRVAYIDEAYPQETTLSRINIASIFGIESGPTASSGLAQLKRVARAAISSKPSFPFVQRMYRTPLRYIPVAITALATQCLQRMHWSWPFSAYPTPSFRSNNLEQDASRLSVNRLTPEVIKRNFSLLLYLTVGVSPHVLARTMKGIAPEKLVEIKERAFDYLRSEKFRCVKSNLPARILQRLLQETEAGKINMSSESNKALGEHLSRITSTLRKEDTEKAKPRSEVFTLPIQAKKLSEAYLNKETILSISSIGFILSTLPWSWQRFLGMGAAAYETVTAFSNTLHGRRTFREIGGKYESMKAIAEENKELEQAMEAFGTSFFTKRPIEKDHTRHIGELTFSNPSLQAYADERVNASFTALANDSDEHFEYIPKTDLKETELKQALSGLRQAFTSETDKLKQLLVDAVNKASTRHITLEDLYDYALETDGIERIKRDFSFTDQKAKLLINRLAHLALYESYIAKIDNTKKALEQHQPIEQIAAILFDKKHYEIEDDGDHRFIIGCLHFEAKSNMWLRKLQAEQMKRALSEKDESVVIEMIPGSGKTSFGIILDLFYNWKPGEVPVAVFTKELITSTKGEIATRYKSLTGRDAFHFSIDRVSENAISVRALLNKLERARDEGTVIIPTKEDLQALELLLVETLYILANDPATSDTYQKATELLPPLQKALHLFSKSRAVVDECHEILRPDEIEKYPIGKEATLPQNHIFGTELVLKHFMPLLQREGFDHTFGDAKRLQAHIPIVAEAIVKDLYFRFTSKEQEDMRAYLTKHDMPPPEWLKKDSRYQSVAMARGVLLDILPNCCDDRIHTTYGLHSKRNDGFVIPYAGNNTPIEDSIFDSPHETLVKTYLYYLQDDSNIFALQKKVVEHLEKIIIPKEQRRLKVAQKETPSYNLLKKISPTGDGSILTKEAQELVPLLYVSLIAAKEIEYYPVSMESTSSNFASMLGHTQYFSGTISNKTVYPHGLRYCRAEETTAQTLNIVAQRLKELGEITTIPETDSTDSFISNAVGKKDCMAAIDAGALFNGKSNQDVAKELAVKLSEKRPEIKAVLFFGSDNTIQVMSTKDFTVASYNPSAYRPEERFTFLDERHTFGVDIPQKRGAGSYITVGQNTLSQIEQACWRLRGLETKDQHVSFALMPHTKRRMETNAYPETFEGIIQHLLSFEHHTLQPQSFQAALQQMQSRVRGFLMQKIHTSSISAGCTILRSFPDLFYTKTEFAPETLYGPSRKQTNPKEHLKKIASVWIERMRAHPHFFTKEEIHALEQEFTSYTPEVLPEFVRLPEKATSYRVHGQRVRQRLSQNTQQVTNVSEEEKDKDKDKTSLEKLPHSYGALRETKYTPWPIRDLRHTRWMNVNGTTAGTRKEIPLYPVHKLPKGSGKELRAYLAIHTDDDMMVSEQTNPSGKTDWSLASIVGNAAQYLAPQHYSQIEKIMVLYDKEKKQAKTIALSKAEVAEWKTRSYDGFATAFLSKEGTLDDTPLTEELYTYLTSEDFTLTFSHWSRFVAKEKPMPVQSLKSIFANTTKSWNIFAEYVLTDDMLVTPNFIPFTQPQSWSLSSLFSSLWYRPDHMACRRKIQNILVIQNRKTNETKTIGLSLAENSEWEKRFEDGYDHGDYSYALVSPTGRVVDRTILHPDMQAYLTSEPWADRLSRWKAFNVVDAWRDEEMSRFSYMFLKAKEDGLPHSQLSSSLVEVAYLRGGLAKKGRLAAKLDYYDNSDLETTIH